MQTFFRRIFGRMDEFRNNEWELKAPRGDFKSFFPIHTTGYRVLVSHRGGIRISLFLMLFYANEGMELDGFDLFANALYNKK